jgi:signal peptidase
MRLRAARKIASSIALAACIALAASVLVPAALGYERYVITGKSMAGTYDRGSIVYARTVPVEALRRGDVITYAPPGGRAGSGLVTHRIVWTGRDRRGRPVFRTKGDANRAVDPWRFSLPHRTQARAAFGIPWLGYALAALSVREVRIVAIGLPALLVAIATLAGLGAELGRLQRAREAAPDRAAGEAAS